MIGQTISHYKILEKLGEGGMGVVYKAEDVKLKRVVALKFLPHHLTRQTEGGQAANETERARLLQEAQAAAGLNHPNICTIYGIEEDSGEQFIAMEFVDGVTLRQKISGRGDVSSPALQGEVTSPLQVDNVIAYAIQIGEALQEAHSKGVIHRDVKLDNIMLNSKSQIKVTDFGLAKLKGSLKLTRTSSTVGTLAYMAPEQIQGAETDARSDIFSFGIVLYEMLTRHLPFRGEHEAAMMYSVLNEEPQPIQKFLPEISSELVHVLNRSLEKDPGDRYQNVSEMVIDLRRLKKESTRVSRTIQIEGESSAMSRKRWSTRWVIPAISVLVLTAILVTYFLFFSAPKPIDSIAVLPFVNVGADPNTEYLSEGLTENLINNLTKLSKLRVVPRSTVFHYKGKESDPLKVGRELNVRAVLTGKITQRGDNLNIQTELLDVKEEAQLWGEQYNRTISGMLTLQGEISKEVARKLRLRMSGEEEKQVGKHVTENSEAFQLYLKGRFYWNKRRAEDLKKAVDYFNQAIDKDPSYALAYAGLAQTYVILPQYAGVSPKEFIPKGEAAAKKALEIDETLAEAHAVLGLIQYTYEWDWAGAEREFKRAIELNPNSPTNHQWYNIWLSSQGRLDEAMKEIKRAQELDPLSLIINVNVGDVLRLMRQYDKAIEQYRMTLELDPNFPIAHIWLGSIYEQKGMYDEAITEFQKVRALVGNSPFGLSSLGHTYALVGRRSDALKVIDELQELSKHGYSVAFDIALVYTGLGEKEKAFEWLDRAYEEHSFELRGLKVHPEWDNLRSDPRFTALLKKIGLGK